MAGRKETFSQQHASGPRLAHGEEKPAPWKCELTREDKELPKVKILAETVKQNCRKQGGLTS